VPASVTARVAATAAATRRARRGWVEGGMTLLDD
jgi:hypothetical protein